MRAQAKPILHFMGGPDKNFVIPVYQRNYDWKKENCVRLFEDLVEVIKNGFTDHFFGSIVSIYTTERSEKEYLIIDGQQRLTTTSLILIAMHQIISEGDELSPDAKILKEKIHDEYLVDKYKPENKKIKLKHVKNDRLAFESIFKNELVPNSTISSNFSWFKESLRNSDYSMEQFYNAIGCLCIVDIELEKGDNPQLIFESLNSTGLALTEADKIRNFVLMDLPAKQQEEYYDKYWNKIEINTNYSVSDFIRDYLTMKENNIPNKDKVYFHFRKYFQAQKISVEVLLEDVLKFSGYYSRIAFETEPNTEIRTALSSINQLETFVSYPFLLEVFDDYDKNIISVSQIIETIKIIESFVFRRLICGVATNSLNKIFMNLAKEIKYRSDYIDFYVEILKHILIYKTGSQRFPNKEDFSFCFKTRDIYNFKNKNKIFLLSKLEGHNNREKADIETLVDQGILNIEHIMPQTLTPIWKKELGEDNQRIHERYLHTIGNLTLTGYNSKMSNKPFIEKRDMHDGFKQSALRLNIFMRNKDHWGETEINERSQQLFEVAEEIWSYPTSKYLNREESEINYYLLSEDDRTYTGEKISAFELLGEKYPSNTWKDTYIQLVNILYDLDPSRILLVQADPYLKSYINSESIRKPHEIAKGFVIETNLSTENILSILRKLVPYFDINLEEIGFYID